MYNPPVELLLSEIKTQVAEKCEEAVYEAVVHYGVSVDREELRKALAYDRQQYEKGYQDAMAELVRCKDCDRWERHTEVDQDRGECSRYRVTKHEDGYCDRAKRRPTDG